MNLPFKHVFSLFAVPALVGLLAFTAHADELKEIRIAVPDLSAGTQHSGGGVVDVLRDQQIFEKAFADQGIKIQWSFFKGAGPVINEAFANGQVDLAYLGDLAAIIGKSNGTGYSLAQRQCAWGEAVSGGGAGFGDQDVAGSQGQARGDLPWHRDAVVV